MYLLKLPISKSEAWRLYNQNRPVLMIKSWTDEGEPLPPGVGYPDFSDNNYFALSLSLEESLPFWQLYRKFAWLIFGAASTGPTGLILAGLSFLTAHPDSLNHRYQLYGLIAGGLLSMCGICTSLLIKQAHQETKLWHKLFDKYQVSDWKNTWR